MEVLKDFSLLGKAIKDVKKEKPAKPEPVAVPGQEALDYFGIGSDDAVENPLDVEEIQEEIQSTIDEIVGEKVAAECRADDAEKGAVRLREQIADLMKEINRLKGDNARMKGELAKLAAKGCPHEDVLQDKTPVKVVRSETDQFRFVRKNREVRFHFLEGTCVAGNPQDGAHFPP